MNAQTIRINFRPASSGNHQIGIKFEVLDRPRDRALYGGDGFGGTVGKRFGAVVREPGIELEVQMNMRRS